MSSKDESEAFELLERYGQEEVLLIGTGSLYVSLNDWDVAKELGRYMYEKLPGYFEKACTELGNRGRFKLHMSPVGVRQGSFHFDFRFHVKWEPSAKDSRPPAHAPSQKAVAPQGRMVVGDANYNRAMFVGMLAQIALSVAQLLQGAATKVEEDLVAKHPGHNISITIQGEVPPSTLDQPPKVPMSTHRFGVDGQIPNRHAPPKNPPAGQPPSFPPPREPGREDDT